MQGAVSVGIEFAELAYNLEGTLAAGGGGFLHGAPILVGPRVGQGVDPVPR
jgi:hypothetical protein